MPPDEDSDWVIVYTNPYGKMISFREIERIEFDASMARKPIPFALRLKLLNWSAIFASFVWGLALGLWLAFHLATHAPKP